MGGRHRSRANFGTHGAEALPGIARYVVADFGIARIHRESESSSFGSLSGSIPRRGSWPAGLADRAKGGTLRLGDVMLCGEAYGRIRAMYNERDEELEEASPSAPVKVARSGHRANSTASTRHTA